MQLAGDTVQFYFYAKGTDFCFYERLRAKEMVVMCKKQTHKPIFDAVCHKKFGGNAPLNVHGI
jgi:hypothetical protein